MSCRLSFFLFWECPENWTTNFYFSYFFSQCFFPVALKIHLILVIPSTFHQFFPFILLYFTNFDEPSRNNFLKNEDAAFFSRINLSFFFLFWMFFTIEFERLSNSVFVLFCYLSFFSSFSKTKNNNFCNEKLFVLIVIHTQKKNNDNFLLAASFTLRDQTF